MKTEDGKYTLEIISENKKTFKEYKVDGHNKIGVRENEPFIIRFKNNTWKNVQVRISIDGTDVLTGNLAHTEPTPDGMWVVQGYKTMELSAWPETNEGGAEFIFGQTKDSVAANTHGNLSAKGLIAVAVFEEDAPSIKITYDSNKLDWSNNSAGDLEKERFTYASNSNDSYGWDKGYGREDSLSVKCCSNFGADKRRGPAVGAGSYVSQNITKTAGLSCPKLSCILQVKYEWWESLRSSLRNEYAAFPGNKTEKFINLGTTPRVNKKSKRDRVEYYRFYE